MLHSALFAIHLGEYDNYEQPANAGKIFTAIRSGVFPLYKEQYIVSQFCGRLMQLESNGWKSLQVTEDVFDMNQWLI